MCGMTARSSSMFPNPPRAPRHAHLSQIDCRPIQVRREGKHSCSWRFRSIYLASLFLLMERVRVASFPTSNLSLEYTPIEFEECRFSRDMPGPAGARERVFRRIADLFFPVILRNRVNGT